MKVNVVVKRGLNEASILDIARRFRGTGHAVRFIEFMDVGATNGWRIDDVVPAAEIVAAIGAEFPLEPVEAAYRGEVAERYRYRDGAGEIGVIASVTQPFCGDCTRARISADGKLYTCLFAVRGHDLRAILRSDRRRARRDDPRRVDARTDRYSELRTEQTASSAQGRDVVHRRLAAYAVGSVAADTATAAREEATPGLERCAPERRISATETSTAAPATIICTVISSPSNSQPSATATIGFTYA